MVERHERGELNLLPSYLGLTGSAASSTGPNERSPDSSHISYVLTHWKS
jgi:hypothetical protein